jgi:hypothetical protein
LDSTFPHATPLLVSSATLGPTVVDSVAVATTINAFIDQRKFQLFVPIFCTDYVGTADRNNAASLHATIQAIKKLAMSYRNPVSGHLVNLTPDDVFAKFSALTPLLPNSVQLWGLNLVTQFHDGLSPALEDIILADATYLPPNLSLLTTRSAQLSAIRMLRAIAVWHYTLLHALERLVNRALARCMKTSITAALSLEPPPPVPPASARVPAPVHTILPASAPANDVSTLSRTSVTPAKQTPSFMKFVITVDLDPHST